MVKAVFLDFYGTVVQEDGKVIQKICRRIARTGGSHALPAVSGYWWESFQTLCSESFGQRFQTQRMLETLSLADTIRHFHSTADAGKLSERMFAYWQKPPIFQDAKRFFRTCPVPIYIVSNIDRSDLTAAVRFHRLSPDGMFTSEDARAYKPRKELFQLALAQTGLAPRDVVHIGDSIGSDIKGAGALGIHTIWINRNSKKVPTGVLAARSLKDALRTSCLKG